MKRLQQEQEALKTFIKEMKELGWEKSPDTKEQFVPYYICFERDTQRIVITYLEFVSFENVKTINGYVLIAITKYLKAVKL
jgi:hypothetical protein